MRISSMGETLFTDSNNTDTKIQTVFFVHKLMPISMGVFGPVSTHTLMPTRIQTQDTGFEHESNTAVLKLTRTSTSGLLYVTG